MNTRQTNKPIKALVRGNKQNDVAQYFRSDDMAHVDNENVTIKSETETISMNIYINQTINRRADRFEVVLNKLVGL